MSSQKLFFSYSRADSTFALKLAKDLRDAGADIWIDQLDIAAGSHWDAAVEKALSTAGYVLVILSPASTASTNVMDEVSFALETGKKVIPVLLEDCLAPFRLRRLQRIDFTTDYSAGFRSLVQSLNLTVQVDANQKDPYETTPQPKTSGQGAPVRDKSGDTQRENQLWEEACKQNTIAAYKQYLHATHTGDYKTEAGLLIKQLEVEQKEDELDSLLWQKAKSENSKSLYQHYLQKYPQGNYKTLALAALADLDREEKEEQKRIKEQEKQLQKEKELREKQEREKALKEKQEKERLLQLEREKERQLQKEKELQEKLEREKALKEKQEKERLLQQEREKQKQLEKEKEKQEKEKDLKEKQERDRIKQLEKETALKEKQARQAQAQPVQPGQPPAGNTNRKYLLIGGGILAIGLAIWAITGMGSGGDGDKDAWRAASLQNDSTAFATYLDDFPYGKFALDAKRKSDSLYDIQQARRDSLNAGSMGNNTNATTGDPGQTPATDSKNVTSAKPVQSAKPKSTSPVQPESKFKLGQTHQGGIVVYINATGEHGLVAAVKDEGKLAWAAAQRKCASYKVEGFSHWRLPTKDELNFMYQNRVQLGGYISNIYWSGTEDGKTIAWGQNFTNGAQGKFDKESECAVRAVHAF